MNKQIIIGVISAVLSVIFIALFVTWIDKQKRDVIETVVNQIDIKTEEITDEIKNERCSRAELAAVLLKSGIDVPTNLLISFSSIDLEEEARVRFLDAYSHSQDIISTKATLENALEKFDKKGLSYSYIAKSEKGFSLLAFSERIYANNPSDEDHSIVLKNDKGNKEVVTIKAQELNDIIDLLKKEGVRAPNIIAISSDLDSQ